jgi:hypothetical protein
MPGVSLAVFCKRYRCWFQWTVVQVQWTHQNTCTLHGSMHTVRTNLSPHHKESER